ncbi:MULTISPECIES: VOC family protein [Metabacillus]|jgi:catechol 2,3-dioxygenase-like lactoylglutathione lyase family enzyme|uniref:Glyoxalase n=3 Tax=Metabacillus TaxID=2675233 RepID=A0A179SMW1_9BACI|nr:MULTISPECIES: VOC family protein [Metabacillus]OAS82997.1 glyoxalase [Metabacillus litoralis]QNF27552.1 VOC family protein [Metabacillus sp. KUDC1714]
MTRKIGHITILVKDYDEAIDYYTNTLDFTLISDNSFGEGMRWVTVAPAKQHETAIVFVEADTDDKKERVGSQAAGHVFLVIETDDCIRDYQNMKEKGVTFLGEPKDMPWGIEVVFEDLYGNRYDLLQVKSY